MSDRRLDFLTNDAFFGELLSERLAAGSLTADEALHFAIEIGAALHNVHTVGRVHTQLSPSCIALAQSGARILTPTASPQETAPYRAPEQLRGDEPDERSDVFAYGAVVYEMVTGKRAFPGTGAELAQQILTQSPTLSGSPTPVGAALERVIAGCLEKDPSRRRQRVKNAVIELKLAVCRRPVDLGLAPGRQVRPVPVPAPELPLPIPSSARKSASRPVSAIDNPPQSPVPAYAALGNRKPAMNAGLAPPGVVRRRASKIWTICVAVLALAATSVAAAAYLHQKTATQVLKFAVTQPEHTSYPGMPSVSPNGRYLTFSAVGPEGRRMLWLRPLDALHATVVQGSEGASAPFWSPDSETIAFFAGKNLKKVSITGGNPETVCPADEMPGGGAWNTDGTILFAPSLAGGFYRVSANGGKPQPILNLDEAKLERGDRWPQFLPDNQHFVFYQQTDLAETSGVYLGSLPAASGEAPGYHRLFASQTNAVYSAADPSASHTGYLLYINDRNLTAQRFDAGRLQPAGDPMTLATDLGAVRSLALAPISVSATGVLVYQGVGQPTRQMVWMDRGGRQVMLSGEPGEWGPPRISPDGHRAAAAKIGTDGKNAHLWLLDVSGPAEEISAEAGVHEGSPVWSPDGLRLAYFSKQDEAYDIYTRSPLPGSKPELLLQTAARKYPTDWSRDGRYLTFSQTGNGTRLDVWGFSLKDHRAAPLLDTVYSEGFGSISPDGKWLAYQSDQSGRTEVYVQPFEALTDGTKRSWMVSNNGGLPRWRSDGSELFYISPDGRMMSVPLRAANDGGIGAGQPQMLFQTRPVPKTWNLYDVSPDGQRFLMNLPLEWTSSAPITVITNWAEKLKQ